MSADPTSGVGTSTIAPTRTAAITRARHVKVDRWFYVGAAVFMLLLSAVGFGPSFVEQAKRTAPPTMLVIAHGFFATMWLLLFLTQAILIATRRTTVHRRVGNAGPVIAAVMIVLGYLTVIEFTRRGYDLSGDLQRAPLPPGFPPPTREEFVAGILAPLSAFVNFGILAAAGLWFRKRPEVHKRLMLFALVSLALTPLIHLSGNVAGRWPGLSTVLSFAVPVVFILVLFISAAHDKLSDGRIHPLSLWVPLLILAESFGLTPILMQSETWGEVAEWLVAK